MDLDYHYGTIYVLARWAKFGSENAHLIASSSQLVDDNFDSTPFSDEEEKKNIAAGVHVRYSCQNIWGNVTGKGNCEIWVPFHFLPGLEGETEDDRLVCKKHSELSQKLTERLLDTSLDDTHFPFRLGVGLHVLADTWAHQEFAGINNIINKVQNLIFATPGTFAGKIVDAVTSALVGKIPDNIMPLGHVAAVHCPDMPYLWWKSGERFTSGRKNWEEFLEASEEIFRLLQEVSCEEVTGLSDSQQETLLDCFKGIQSDDIDVRYRAWIDRIHENHFDFEDFDEGDATVEYSIPFIFDDVDFRRQFYDEINDHFDWVRSELEAHNIFILQSDPIY